MDEEQRTGVWIIGAYIVLSALFAAISLYFAVSARFTTASTLGFLHWLFPWLSVALWATVVTALLELKRWSKPVVLGMFVLGAVTAFGLILPAILPRGILGTAEYVVFALAFGSVLVFPWLWPAVEHVTPGVGVTYTLWPSLLVLLFFAASISLFLFNKSVNGVLAAGKPSLQGTTPAPAGASKNDRNRT